MKAHKQGTRILSLLLAAVTLITVFKLPSLKANAQDEKLVAITFDDGPGLYTSDLIDRLNERDVKATFFIVGSNAEYYPDVIKKAAESGHQIGNHSYDHSLLTKLNADEIQNEIDSTNRLLKQADGNDTHYLRPPYGEYNSDVASAANAPMVYWSVDTEDWKTLDSQAVYDSIMNNVYDGAIILCHDIYDTSCDGAIMAIDALKADGWTFVTVEELLTRRGITPENGVMYYDAKSSSGDSTPTAEPTEEPKENTESSESTEDFESTTLTKEITLYSEASESSDVVGLISGGTSAEISKTETDGFKLIKTAWGTKGYAKASSLEDNENEDPERKSDSPTVPDSTLNIRKVTKSTVTLYGSSDNTSVLGYIGGKEEVTVLDKTDDGICLVKTDSGKLGYTTEKALQNYHTQPYKSVILDIPETGTLLTDTNLRSSPSENSAIKGVLSKGAELTVIGSSGMWFEVSWGDISGYIRDYTLSRSEKSCFEKAYITEDTKLKSSRKDSSDSIGTVKEGASVYIISTNEDDFTMILTSSGAIGYVKSTAIETS